MMGWGKKTRRPEPELVQVTLAHEVAAASRLRLNQAIAHRKKMDQIFDDLLPNHEAR